MMSGLEKLRAQKQWQSSQASFHATNLPKEAPDLILPDLTELPNYVRIMFGIMSKLVILVVLAY